jgi:hypothetical protein
VNCGAGVAAKIAPEGVTALGVSMTIDDQMGPTSVAAISKVDAGGLMVELVSLLIAYCTKLNAEGEGNPKRVRIVDDEGGEAGRLSLLLPRLRLCPTLLHCLTDSLPTLGTEPLKFGRCGAAGIGEQFYHCINPMSLGLQLFNQFISVHAQKSIKARPSICQRQ